MVLLLVLRLLLILRLGISLRLGDQSQRSLDSLRDWGRGWQMGAFGTETVLIRHVRDANWSTIWRGVRIRALNYFSFLIFDTSIF